MTLIVSCKNEKANVEKPSLSQSIEFITQKINNREISGNRGVISNVKFRVEQNRVNYSYEYIFAAENTHYKVVQLFYLKDIKWVNTNHFDFDYIKLTLDKRDNHRFVESMNSRSLADYGQDKEEWLDEVFINVRSSDKNAVEKAFNNISELFKEQRGEKYFNE
jgi:hypothetical protein